MKKVISILAVFALFGILFTASAAGSANLVASSTQVNVGDEITVDLKVDGLTGVVSTLSWDTAVLEFVPNSGKISNGTGVFDPQTGKLSFANASAIANDVIFTVKLKAVAEGSGNVAMTFEQATDDDLNDVTIQDLSLNITVAAAAISSEVPAESSAVSVVSSAPTGSELSSGPSNPQTGESGIALFAALALITGAATVIITKKASK